MKTAMGAIMSGCLFLMVGTMCFAADTTPSQPVVAGPPIVDRVTRKGPPVVVDGRVIINDGNLDGNLRRRLYSLKPVAGKGPAAVETVTGNDDNLRRWLNSIKPAAGKVDADRQQTGYWQQSVRRENRGRMQE